MLSSKEILAQTQISRATLNNYIGLGLVPRPEVRNPGDADPQARRIGFFPDGTVSRIEEIKRLKSNGLLLSDIAQKLGCQTGGRQRRSTPADSGAQPQNCQAGAGPASSPPITVVPPGQTPRGLQLSLADIDYPAYLVNNKFEIEWANPVAESEIFSADEGLSADIGDRNLFRLLIESGISEAVHGDDLLAFHLSIAKNRLSKAALLTLDSNFQEAAIEQLSALYDRVDALKSRAVRDLFVNLSRPGEDSRCYKLYASFFREGVFFAYAPSEEEEDTLLSFLARRDLVIRDLLKNRRPYMTPLAVLVADIQNSVQICAELPPEEYFELINQVWSTMEPIFRKYYATHGKHVGDGIVYYFFPQPDSNYIMNALRCAHEMQRAMTGIDRQWKQRKGWANRLLLNFGLDEGQEWFGAYQTPTHLEFSVLGDTINRAARLSDFSTGGTVWVTKNMLSSLSCRERNLLDYGIRRQDNEGREAVVAATYGRIANLCDLDAPTNCKLKDIATLPVTEILDFRAAC